MKTIITGILFAVLTSPVITQFSELKYEQNSEYHRFSHAKKALYSLPTPKETFYCKCSYNRKKKVDLNSCSYNIWKFKKRAQRVEVEHIVPAHTLCGQTPEWKLGHHKCTKKNKPYKGRKCATKTNKTCIRAYNDLHNLRPSIGEINAMRSNFHFNEIEGEERKFGICNFEVRARVAEPPDSRRGEIARIYLFMNHAYKSLQLLDEKEYRKFIKWSNEDPVDHEECKLNENIFKVQGTYNVIVKTLCKKLYQKQ